MLLVDVFKGFNPLVQEFIKIKPGMLVGPTAGYNRQARRFRVGEQPFRFGIVLQITNDVCMVLTSENKLLKVQIHLLTAC
jgi:hypothetical protein